MIPLVSGSPSEGAKGALIYVDGLVEVPGRRRPRIWRDGFGLRKTPV